MECPPPSQPRLSRRRLLRWGAIGGIGLISACATESRAQLLYSRGELPAAWLKQLPDPWRGQAEEDPAELLSQLSHADLLQWPEGWIGDLSPDQLQPFAPPGTDGAESLFADLAPFATPITHLFGDPAEAPVAYPWAFGTWWLVLRNRRDLAERQTEGWSLLLDASLKGLVVLPSSPRVVIEICRRQLAVDSQGAGTLADPRLVPQLRRLRGQALAFDERDGLNLLLRGKAEAAVVASQRLFPLLRSDSRLTALLPASGSPLWLNLLLRPAGSREPAPLAWLRQAHEPALLARLLAAGWVPPLRRPLLVRALAAWPQAIASMLYPDPAVLANCNALPPLSREERLRYQQLWDRAA